MRLSGVDEVRDEVPSSGAVLLRSHRIHNDGDLARHGSHKKSSVFIK